MEEVKTDKDTWWERTQLKFLINKFKRRKKKLLKKNHEEAINKAKNSIYSVLSFIKLEQDGKEITSKDIEKLNDDEIIELFDEVVGLLENMYINKKER